MADAAGYEQLHARIALGIVNGPLQDPILVIAPHYDDAVFGCADLLSLNPGTVVLTAFGGRPTTYPRRQTRWDRGCGFGPGDDPVLARRQEDAAALQTLGARQAWLEFLDLQYRGDEPKTAEIADAIETILVELGSATLVAPLGLRHRDHRLAAVACLELCSRSSSRAVVLYDDSLRRAQYERDSKKRLNEVEELGFTYRELDLARVEPALKKAAVDCYQSQLQNLGDISEGFGLEHYWLLEG